jgi:Zn-dependent protease
VKVLGIPTRVEPSFLVLSLFLGASRGLNLSLLLEWLVVVFISILVHELGHALVARRFGLSPVITLYSMGGLTSWGETKEVEPLKHLAISLAGPAAGFLLGGILFVTAPTLLTAVPSELLTVAYRDLLWINIGWGVFNLFPILPLDGGHVLLTLERWVTGKQHQIVSHAISLLVALAITYFAFTYRSLWIAFLGIWFAYTNASFLLASLKSSRDKKLQPRLEEARNAITAEKLDLAIEIISEIKKTALTDWFRREASRLLIFTLIRQGKYKEAEEELIKFYGLFGEEHFLQGVLSFEKGETSKAIPHLKTAFAQSPEYQLGLMLSQALMREKRYAEVLDLCGRAEMAEAILPLSVNLQTEAFENNEFEIAGRAGVLAYERKPDPNIAYNAACAFARASASTRALACLERAISSGFNDRDVLVTDPDLESIRFLPEFDDLLARMR